jgi:circadian clock protein KaiC
MAKTKGKAENRQVPLPKVSSGISGLDEILEGGFPEARTTLISGGPGSGKSVIGLEFLYRSALAGEPAIFVAFEERASEVKQNALTMGWNLDALEQAGKLFVLEAKVDPAMVLAGDFNLQGLLAIIAGKASAMGAKRIVIDAIDVLLRLFDDPVRERNEMYLLHDWLKNQQLTSLLTVKTSLQEVSAARFAFLDFMAETVVHLDHRVIDQVATRRLRIVKYRGSGFGSNEYPCVITDAGLSVMPTSRQALVLKPMGDKFSSGLERLDTILDGGFRKNASIMIAGPSGTGKTTLVSTIAHAACQRGERFLFISFEESEQSMVESMCSPGLNLAPSIKAGKLKIHTAMPESMGAEEHLVRILKELDAMQPDCLAVDATSSCERMGSEQAAFDFVMRILTLCKERGITCFLINQTKGIDETSEISGNGFSSLLDGVLFMRYSIIGGEINRMLTLLKMRGSKHSNQYREYLITDHGIDILDVYSGEGGVLTGAARQEQEEKERIEVRYKALLLEKKKAEIVRMEKAMEAETLVSRAAIVVQEKELAALEVETQSLLNGKDARADLRSRDKKQAVGGKAKKSAAGKASK